MDSLYWQVELHYILEITPPEACLYGTVDGWPQNNPPERVNSTWTKVQILSFIDQDLSGTKDRQGQKINQTWQAYQTHQTLHTDQETHQGHKTWTYFCDETP